MSKIITKDSIRKRLLIKRKGLGQDVISKKSAEIFENLLKIDKFLHAKSILLYLPINNEVETRKILDYSRSKDQEIYLPAYFNGKWVCSKFDSETDLISGPYGTMQQPKKSGQIEGNLDLAIVPGVGFSNTFVRLGYGKGVYDRLLSESSATKIGLGFEFQILEDIPFEPHDLKMDFVVTNRGVLSV